MNVLSLFDGCSGGQVALQKLINGWKRLRSKTFGGSAGNWRRGVSEEASATHAN